MNTKQKPRTSKETWQAGRARYTWHLRPPFKGEFDRSDWWKGKPSENVKPVAALYELARRHPRIGELRRRLRDANWYGQELRAPLAGAAKERLASEAFDDLGQEPNAIHCLCLIGLRSWPTLDWKSQEYWEMSAGNMKGIDCRVSLEQCWSLTSAALCDVIHKRRLALKLDRKASQFWVGRAKDSDEDVVVPVDPGAFKKSIQIVVNHLAENPITNDELEAAFVGSAVSAHRQGHWLFAVAPDLTHEKAAHLLAQTYREEQRRYPRSKPRGRWEDWLSAIAVFEQAEMERGGAKSKAFTSYRRILDNLRFASLPQKGLLPTYPH
jgi:hypothetical protein